MSPSNKRERRGAIVVSAAFCLLACGCFHRVTVDFINGADSKVAVTSLHTGRTVEVRRGERKNIPHSGGSMIVTAPDGEKLLFEDIAPFFIDRDRLVRTKGFITGPKDIRCFVILETNLQLYVADWRWEAARPQPSGYPKTGRRLDASENDKK